jgi:hypothetical protein
MNIKSNVLALIDTRDIRFKLAMALDVSDPTIRRYINENTDDLTKAAALKVIREVTGLTDNDILREIEECAKVQPVE